VEFIAGHFGFSVERFPWSDFFSHHPDAVSSMRDYRDGWRENLLLYALIAGRTIRKV
jgi:hypothetical protein